jgi:hypothetical protein
MWVATMGLTILAALAIGRGVPRWLDFLSGFILAGASFGLGRVMQRQKDQERLKSLDPSLGEVLGDKL